MLSNDSTTTEYYRYLDTMLMAEAPTRSGPAATTYVQDWQAPLSRILEQTINGTTSGFVYSPSGERLLTTRSSGDSFALTDHLGTPRLTLGTDGAVQSSSNYTLWGETEGTTSPNPFGFTGELQDVDNGLIHLRARWYNPETGTFLGRDPFDGWDTEPYSQQLYQYAHGNPVSNTDPTGMCTNAHHCYPKDIDIHNPHDVGRWFIWLLFHPDFDQNAAADQLNQFTVAELDLAAQAYAVYMAAPHMYTMGNEQCVDGIGDIRGHAARWSQYAFRQSLYEFVLNTQAAQIAYNMAMADPDISIWEALLAIEGFANANGVGLFDVAESVGILSGITSGLGMALPFYQRSVGRRNSPLYARTVGAEGNMGCTKACAIMIHQDLGIKIDENALNDAFGDGSIGRTTNQTVQYLNNNAPPKEGVWVGMSIPESSTSQDIIKHIYTMNANGSWIANVDLTGSNRNGNHAVVVSGIHDGIVTFRDPISSIEGMPSGVVMEMPIEEFASFLRGAAYIQ